MRRSATYCSACEQASGRVTSAVLATRHETAASGWRELLAGLLTAAAVTCAWRHWSCWPGRPSGHSNRGCG